MRIDFEQIQVPTEELDQVITEKMDEIRKVSRRNKKKKIVAACTTAAAAFTVGFMLLKANPVIAAQLPLVGHLFEKVEDKMFYSGDIKKNAKVLEGDDKVQESGGIKVTFSEVYCNPEALYLSVMAESEEGFPDNLRAIDASYGNEKESYLMMRVKEKFDFLPEPVEDYLQFNGEYIDEHTFVGGARIDFGVNELDKVEIPEQFKLDMEISEIYGSDYSVSEEQKQAKREAEIEELLKRPEYARITDKDGQVYIGDENDLMVKWFTNIQDGRETREQAVAEYNQAFQTQITAEEFQKKYDAFCETIQSGKSIGGSESKFYVELAEKENTTYQGTWNFQVEISNETSHAEKIEVNAISPEGYGIESVVKTPYELIINEKYTDNKELAPLPEFFDAKGRHMTCKANMEIPVRDYDISTVYVYYYNCNSQEIVDAVQEHSEKDDFREYMESIAIFKTQFET